MNTNAFKALAIGAGLLTAGVAFGQTTVTVNDPTSDNAGLIQTVGPNSLVDIGIAENLATDLADADVLQYAYRLVAVTANGMTQVVVGNTTIPAAAIDRNQDMTFGDPGDGDTVAEPNATISFALLGAGFNTVLNFARGVVNGDANLVALYLVIEVTDQQPAGALNVGSTAITFNVLPLDPNTVNNATTEAPLVDEAPLAITNAFISTAGANTVVNLVFNRALSNGLASNDFNQTSAADLLAVVLADLQLSPDASFAVPVPIVAAPLTGAAFATPAANGPTALTLTFSSPGNLAAGQFIRVITNDRINDILGNDAASDLDGAQITNLPTMTIQSVDLLTAITPGTNNLDAVRVTYSLPVNPADPGDAPFYGANLFDENGAAVATLVLANPGVDPDNANAVLLDLNAGGGAPQIFSDARDANGAGFSLITDGTQNVPSSIFSLDDFGMVNQTVALDDAIAPTLIQRSFHDLNSDGKVDAVAFIFDEALTATTANTGYTVIVNNNTDFQPLALLDASTGILGLATTDIPAAPNNQITVTGVSVGTLVEVRDNVAIAGVPAGRSNNALILSFNPDDFDFDADPATDTAPGTGDGGIFNIAYDSSVAGAQLADASGNAAPSLAAADANFDLAPPLAGAVFFMSGDNQIAPPIFQFFPVGGSSNAQFLWEQDGILGDANVNNRAVIFATESFNAGAPGAVVPNAVTYGPTFTAFTNNNFVGGDFLGFFSPDNGNNTNGLAFSLRETAVAPGNLPTNGLQPGVQITVDSGSGIVDAGFLAGGGSELIVNGAILVNGTAPYVALQADVNNNLFAGAYLVDDDSPADGLANRVLLVFNDAIDASTLNAADFTLSRGQVASVELDPADATQRTVAIAITGNVSVNSTITVTYNATPPAASLVASDPTAGGLGNAVDDVTTVIGTGQFPVTKLQAPFVSTDAIAIQPILGTVTINGEPVQQGTKVFASVAVPTVFQVEATHNNVFFQYRRNFQPTYAGLDDASLDEWTSWLLGVFPDLYLLRNDLNQQVYWHDKDITGAPIGPAGADTGAGFYNDGIRLNINANNLTNITFTGNGETNTDRIQSGRARLAWDVLRSADGRLGTFFRSGYSSTGTPIVSSAVIDNALGTYELYVSAPVAAFNGISRFNSVNWPIIIWVELPDGTRQVVSSLLTSVNGAPVLFNPANRTQNQGNAPDALSFNINLDNVGIQRVFDGWNTIPFGRVSGWAQAQNNVPTRPDGIPAPTNDSTSAIQVGSSLPAVSALEQFVWFNDTNNDGVWDRTDDAGTRFVDIIIDSKFIPNFAFTMTSFGVQAGASINNLIGGYALGFFSQNPGGNPLGVFQFGAPLDQAAFFTTNSFPNNTTTQGWALLSRTQPGAITNAVGNRVDYVIWFNNRGPNSAAGTALIEVKSLDVMNPGTNNPNDLAGIDAADVPAALFTHFIP